MSLNNLQRCFCINNPFRTFPKQIRFAHSNKIPVISAKRKSGNFFKGQTYNTLDEVKLVSKGWRHSKSSGDYFVVHADFDDVDKPCIPFGNLDVHPEFVAELAKQEIHEATQFQADVLPAIRMGKHVMMAAETGCGKTYAYLLPLMERLLGPKPEEMNTPQMVILMPNRELAHQVGAYAQRLGSRVGLNVRVSIGGRTKREMMNPEFSQIDILVGTPGAIGKLSTVGVFKLNQVKYAVLDECDTLLDDSFVERIESLVRRMPQAQLVLSSATLPKNLPASFEPVMNNMVQVTSQRLHRPLMNITQRFLRLTKSSRPSQLLLTANKIKHPMIIFTNRNETSNWVALFLRENGIKCSNINGDMNHAIRIKQWDDFMSGETKILSSTDVGSRGLDTTQVRNILNYDFPYYAADYIHRIGRIGRLGGTEDCRATNFISGISEVSLVQNIEMAIRTHGEIRNVDGNITNIVQKKIMKNQRETV